MKRFFLLLFIFAASFVFAEAQSFYASTETKVFREGRDKEFRSKEESPLKEEDFPKYKGLKYFGTSKKYIVTAGFTRTADEKYFQMPTSSGKTKRFIKYGILTFRLNGAEHKLSAYQMDEEVLKKYPEEADMLFVPFKDLTNGKQTYGGGRYLSVRIPKDGKAVLNFNNVYNPSCAYGSDRYNCPIPPRENFLRTQIKAGEKVYFKEKH